MALRPEEVSSVIAKEIGQYQSKLEMESVGTVLQVVRNPGWFMPYVSCILVTIGMLMHFGLSLVNFLNRRAVP